MNIANSICLQRGFRRHWRVLFVRVSDLGQAPILEVGDRVEALAESVWKKPEDGTPGFLKGWQGSSEKRRLYVQ